MALQSSGQISLSQIATEFGGSAPHSLSEYYGNGNAPASGEIQLAADFYGTSNSISFSSTITCGSQVHKAGINTHGWVSPLASAAGVVRGGAATNFMGSAANINVASGVTLNGIYSFFDITAGNYILEFSTATTNWTQFVINGQTLTRASAAVANSSTKFTWSGYTNINQVLPSSGTLAFTIS
jgi:hypothetical protein